MNDEIGRELRQAVAEQMRDIEPPEFEAVLARASRRQRRGRLVSAAGVFVGVVATVGVVWVLISAGPGKETGALKGSSPSSSSTKPVPATFTVPTNGWQPGDMKMDSRVRGTLRFTVDGCPFLESPGATVPRIWVAFPKYAIGVKDESGKRHVTDPAGRVYGAEGEVLDGGGGPVERDIIEDGCRSGGDSTYGLGVMNRPTGKVIDLAP